MRRMYVAAVAALLVSLSQSFHAQAPGAGPFTFDTLAYGESGTPLLSPAGILVDNAGTVTLSQSVGILRISATGTISTLASVFYARGMSVDSAGNTYVAAWFNNNITKVAPDGTTSVFASGGGFTFPTDVVVMPDGSAYVTSLNMVHHVTPTGVVSLFAGSATSSGSADGTGTNALFRGPAGLAAASDGSVWISDSQNHTIRRMTSAAVVTTIAGTAQVSGTADGTGAAAGFNNPGGVAVGSDGSIYVADTGNHAIRKMTPAGVVTTLAGTPGVSGFADGTGAAARFTSPVDVAVDAAGNVYVAELGNHLVRRITPAGVVTTVAGVPPRSHSGISIGLVDARGVAVSPAGLVYVADTANHVIKRLIRSTTDTSSASRIVAGATGVAGSADGDVAPAFSFWGIGIDGDGNIRLTDSSRNAVVSRSPEGFFTVVAGSASAPAWRDGTGAQARFDSPRALAVSATGDMYIAEQHTIRKVTPAGVVTTLAGMDASVVIGGDGTGAAAAFVSASGIAVNASGTVYVADAGAHTIRAITPAGVVTTLAGLAGASGTTDGTGGAARFHTPTGLAIDAQGTVYVAEWGSHTVRKVTPDGVVTTLAGAAFVSGHVDGAGSAARFYAPSAVAVDADGVVTVLDNLGHLVRRITADGVVTTVAGSVVPVGSVDGVGTAAGFAVATAVAVEGGGSVLVTDNKRVRRVAADGTVTTLVNAEQPGGDARFNAPAGIVSDASGVLYVADTGNHTIRRVTDDGAVSTLAGLAGSSGSADGTGTAARFSSPAGIATAGTSIYIADTGNHTVRMIAAGGVVTTLAGAAGESGSTDGTGVAARFNGPQGVAVAGSGTVYVADTGNHVIRQITSGGVVTTLAGTAGAAGHVDGTGAAARFSSPAGIAIDAEGNLLVSDAGTHTIRAITPAGVVTTVGGLAETTGHVDAEATTARFNAPAALAFDAWGTLYLADVGNDAVRRGVTGTATAPVITTQPVSQSINQGQTATFTVATTGNPHPIYQWYYRSTSSGNGFPIETARSASFQPGSGFTSGEFRVVVTNGSGSATSNWASLTVKGLELSPTTIRLGAVRAAVGQPLSSVSPPQTVTVTFAGQGTPAWTATSLVPWLQISGGSGTGAGSFTVAFVDPQNMLAAYGRDNNTTSLEGFVSVTAPNLGLTTDAPVRLNLATNTPTLRPTGAFDSPANGATGITGTIGVTGWAVDDVYVARVEIWRNCVEAIDRALGACAAPTSSSAANFVRIGDATFVPGARPDIQTHGLYGTFPAAARAGWGYLLLTNALPHIPNGTPQGGQGTFTLTAFAVDAEGQYTQLGAKTITLANDTATVPFGAIDTPEQGATIPGAAFPYNEPHAYPVFGWAMTQSGKCIDTTSAAVYKVFVDGVQRTLTPGTNWFAGLNRSDVAAAYPGLCNTNNAVAAYYLDTRTLANGLHTIGWEVTDSNGQTAGIGSRFFNVLNTGGDAGAEAPASTGTDAPRRQMEADASASASVRTTARALRAAIGQADTSVWVRASEDGVYRVRMPQTGRLAVDLDGAVTSGHQKVGDEWVALPAGSTLDAEAGRFFWQPPVGFLGAFPLAFVSGGERIDVEVTIVDPTAGGGEAEVTITSPRAGANPNPIITVAGTARDPQALTGTGIDTVHVWARRLDGPVVASPVFLGKAQYSEDMYSLTSSPLAPGTYQIEVYAWVARLGEWAPAATVVIAVR